MTEGFTYNIETIDLLTQAEVYGKVLVEMGQKNKDIVVLTADLMRSNKTKEFHDVFPERYFNVGIAEQNLFSVARHLQGPGTLVLCSIPIPGALKSGGGKRPSNPSAILRLGRRKPTPK